MKAMVFYHLCWAQRGRCLSEVNIHWVKKWLWRHLSRVVPVHPRMSGKFKYLIIRKLFFGCGTRWQSRRTVNSPPCMRTTKSQLFSEQPSIKRLLLLLVLLLNRFSSVRLLATPRTAAYQLLHPWDFPGKSTGVGCHCLLRIKRLEPTKKDILHPKTTTTRW